MGKEIDYKDQLYTCNKCGYCLSNCPIYKQTLDETYTARGMLTMAEAAQAGKIDYSPALNERLSTCINCLACADDCPSGLRPFNLIQQTKEKLIEEQGMDIPKRMFCRTIVKNQWLLGKALKWGKTFGQIEGNVPSGAKKNFFRLFDEFLEVEKPKANIGFFVGCAINLWYPQIGVATVKLLTDAGYQVSIPKAQKCCGTPVQTLGDVEAARNLMLDNIKAFSKVDAIVTACASCGLMLKKESARLGIPESFRKKVFDITEFIVDNDIKVQASLKKGRSGKNVKLTYHDPCHLNRGQGISSQPRELIDGIKGSQLVEVENAQECCGGGGTFRLFNQDLALKIAASKIEAVEESAASMLVTSCPGCIMQFDDVFQQRGKGLDVRHVVELLAL
ncbi:MAG TPA: (Fe-S)-binding protein [Actinobacteria bacterium]|nr:(Fe-S)-binding protein [Actinomycetota bacterium]